MFDTDLTESREKLALVWAERRQRMLAVRVQYDVRHEDGCKFFQLRRIESID